MRDRLEGGILERVPGCFVTGDPNDRLPNTSNIAFESLEAQDLLALLDKHGVAASSGSACTSGTRELSHVMRAMNVPYAAGRGSIRFSLSRSNTMNEVERVITAVPPIVVRARQISRESKDHVDERQREDHRHQRHDVAGW